MRLPHSFNIYNRKYILSSIIHFSSSIYSVLNVFEVMTFFLNIVMEKLYCKFLGGQKNDAIGPAFNKETKGRKNCLKSSHLLNPNRSLEQKN